MTEKKSLDVTTNDTHGTITSYAIGFVASLALTIIPFFLVTLHVLTGTMLLIALIGIAIAQMMVQMYFFLHLGRGPKPLYNVVFFFATAGLIVLVIGASLIIMNSLYRNMSPEEYTTRLAQEENIVQVDGHMTGACKVNKHSHEIFISNSAVRPTHIEAKRCDTIVFKSSDGADYMLMFGPENSPISYGGQDAVLIGGDRSSVVTLNQTGDFSFHDHSVQEITGSFTVRP